MKESIVVNQIKEQYTKTPFKFDEEKKDFFSPNEELVNKAIIKLCELWNTDEKTRGFVKHILHSFIPIDPWSKVLNFGNDPKTNRRCAILGIKCASINEIADHWGKRKVEDLILQARIEMEKEGLDKEKEMKLREAEIKKMPIEVRNRTIAYMSDKSEKILSGEAIAAIQIFLDNCLFGGEKEISYLLTKIRNSQVLKDKGFTKKEVEQVTRAASGDKPCLNDETIDKLKKLKEELENKK